MQHSNISTSIQNDKVLNIKIKKKNLKFLKLKQNLLQIFSLNNTLCNKKK